MDSLNKKNYGYIAPFRGGKKRDGTLKRLKRLKRKEKIKLEN